MLLPFIVGCTPTAAPTPETEAPETKAPETEAPETEAPETDAPETKAPETEAPETEVPETEAPETEAPETDAPETDAPETKAPETEAPETEAPETEAPETEAPETEAPETEASSQTTGKITFDGIVAVDNEDCYVKITGIDPDNYWGYTLNVYFENRSSDKKYMFSVMSASINGVECDPFFATEVAAGKKANDEINFDIDELEECGVSEITDIEITIRVYDSEDWTADDVVHETFNVYPYGKDAATKYVREAKETDTVIVDNDSITVIATGYEYDDIWGYTVNFYLVNKTDMNLMISVDDASVNGYMLDPFFATEVIAGKSEFTSMSWSDDDFAENSITDVEEIEFTIRAYDYDNWLADDIVNEKVVLNP